MNINLLLFYAIGIVAVLGASLTFSLLSFRYKMKVPSWSMWLLILASVYMLVAQYLKYRSLHFYVDFSHWAELLYSISRTGRPFCLSADFVVPGIMNYFSAHFVPLIYILALPFKLCPYSETIIFLNFFLMVSSVIPLYKLSVHYNTDKQFGLFIAALLLWYPTFQYIVLYEFEMLRFSIPIILWMLYFWEKKKMILYFIFVFLAVLVREEIGLTIAMFGLYLLFIERKRNAGLITLLIGLGAFVVITQIVIPYLSTSKGGSFVAIDSFSTFGDTPGRILLGIISHPILMLLTIFQTIKLANIFMLFLPLLFVPLLAPSVLIAVLANIGVGLLSRSNVHFSYMLYYLSPSVPFIFYAFIKGWPKLLVLLETLSSRWKYDLRGNVNSAAMAAVFSGLLISNVFFGPSPISLQFWFKDLRPAPFRTLDFHYSVYRITDHHRKVEEFCNLISDSSIVSAQHFLFPPLFKKRGTMIFPQLETLDGKIKADYVFFDKTNNGLKKGSPAHETQFEFDLVEKDKKTWRLIKSEDGYFLYKRIRE